MDEDREYLPLSWLSQADYCLRRAVLLLNERVWVENADTAKGRMEHKRVHNERIERRGEQLKLYEYTVFSDVLGISGKCDCIEAQRCQNGCRIPAVDFPVILYPIEYKHGTMREEQEYNIQLCAQAICLEEMYHTNIPEGAIFYISSHKRQTVKFSMALRNKVTETAAQLGRLREEFIMPSAVHSPKCKGCSLADYCMPKTKQSAREYCTRMKAEATGAMDIKVSVEDL